MDKNILGSVLLSFIQAKYPGGNDSFVNDGGLISIVPFKEDTALIYVPHLTKEFENDIEQLNNHGIIHLIYTNNLNFKNQTPSDILPILMDTCKDISEKYSLTGILLNPTNPLILFITIPFAILSDDIAEDIIRIFVTRIPSISRGVLIISENIYPFSEEGALDELKTTTDKIPKVYHDTETIPDESIEKLKDILNKDMDVIEFLEQIERK